MGIINPEAQVNFMHKFNPINPPPDGASPQDVRFLEFRVEPWPEGDKIRIHAQITPFLKPPDLEAVLFNSEGNEISSVNIIENIDFNLVFTMHIRFPSPDGKYTLTGNISYEDTGIVHETKTSFELPTH